MQKRTSARIPAVTASLFAVAFALDPAGLLAASDCLEQPSRSQGSHWYYHLERTSGRKCWHLKEGELAAKPPQAEVPAPLGAPEPARQPPPFSSFFSSLTSGFTTAGAPQPDAANRDPRGMAIVQPGAPRIDDAAPKRRRADAKAAPVPKPDRQDSSRGAKAPADQPRPVSLDQAERDRLFQDFLRWKERQ